MNDPHRLLALTRSVVEGVPDYREFMTVDELVASSRRLVREHHDVAELVEVSSTRTGEPLYALVLHGGESRRVLAFAFPHPNEPVGSLTLEYLSWRLARDRDLLRELDATWIVVKVADVYGARLNEGWFKGPFDVRRYALNYYRPPPYKQVEWSFPVEYKGFRFDRPVEETRAIMRLIDEWKPTHIYSLHNAGFTGTYYYVSRQPPSQVLRLLTELPKTLGVPIHRGEPETPYMEKLAEGLFRMPSFRDIYDWLEGQLGRPPHDVINHGGSSYDYAARVNPNVFELVCEVPYIYDYRLDIDIEIGVPRREVLRVTVRRNEEELKAMKREVERLENRVSADNPFFEALKSFIEFSEKHIEAEKRWVETAPELDASATVAQAFDAYLRTYWGPILRYGLLYRSTVYELERGHSDRVLEDVKGRALKRLDALIEVFNRLTRYYVIPVRNLVAIQVAAVISTVLGVA